MRAGWSTTGVLWAVVPAAPGDVLSVTRALFVVETDLTLTPPRFGVPVEHACNNIQAIVDTIAGGATSITFSVWRDAAGTVPFINDGPAGTTVTMGLSAAGTEGGATIYAEDADHHLHPTYSVLDTIDREITDRRTVKLYAGLELNAGTARLLALGYNWRA